MTRPARTSDHRSNVNINSVHLPVAVAVWQAPKIISTLLSAGGSVVLFILAVALFSHPISKTSTFSQETRAKNDYFDWCYSNTRLQRPDLSRTDVFRYCRSAAGFAP